MVNLFLRNVDMELLKEQARTLGNVRDNNPSLNSDEISALEGVWNLLEVILDEGDKQTEDPLVLEPDPNGDCNSDFVLTGDSAWIKVTDALVVWVRSTISRDGTNGVGVEICCDQDEEITLQATGADDADAEFALKEE